ncbi:MAG: hypothetical protein ACRC0L_13190 [Angustibacter sp.]
MAATGEATCEQIGWWIQGAHIGGNGVSYLIGGADWRRRYEEIVTDTVLEAESAAKKLVARSRYLSSSAACYSETDSQNASSINRVVPSRDFYSSA